MNPNSRHFATTYYLPASQGGDTLRALCLTGRPGYPEHVLASDRSKVSCLTCLARLGAKRPPKMHIIKEESMSQWPRSPLSAADHAAMDKIRWRTFPRETVVSIAEAWNAGMVTVDMARDLGCKPGSLRVLIGRLAQIGVRLRPARDPLRPSEAFVPAPLRESEPMPDERLTRLRRVAAWDPAAKRALELYEREVRA